MIEITEESIKLFSKVSGDYNPIHLDETFAKNTVFKQRIAHGMLIASYISKEISENFDSPIFKDFSISFKKPAYIGDFIKIVLTESISFKNKIKLSISVINQNNEEIISGESVIVIRKKNIE